MTSKKPDGPDWSAIRKACEAGGQTIAEIARRHNVSPHRIYRKRRQWARDDEQGAAELDHQKMVQRLYNATDQQIRHLESRLASGEAAFDEKEARMLGTIARTLDKIMELTPRDTQPKSKPAKSAKEKGSDETSQSASDLDALRKELAHRLDRLQQGRKDGLSGKS